MRAHGLREESSLGPTLSAAHEKFGRIDILLNNAAIFYDMELEDRSLEYFNKVLAVNLTGVWLCTRAVEPYMKRQRKGKIIHQSSTAAYIGNAAWWIRRIPTRRHRPRTTASRRSACRG